MLVCSIIFIMCEKNMNIRFESTKKFEKELNKFPDKERGRIVQKLNQYTQLLESDVSAFYKHVYKPIKLKLVDDESSLYVLKIGQDIRIILTVDEDPIFEQTLVTLIRIVKNSKLEKVFKGIAESLYQYELNS